jgi:lipopolysaccharide/colanic/teichoic acid biosynthesis glycosyltransferase
MLNTKRLEARSRLNTGDLALPSKSFLSQEGFLQMLALERKRTERSRQCFVLMLLEPASLMKGVSNRLTLEKVLLLLDYSTRETDIKGWYQTGAVVGVIFTGIGAKEGRAAVDALSNKVLSALGRIFSAEQIDEIQLSFHLFPEDWEKNGFGGSADSALYPDLQTDSKSRAGAHLVKRAMDVIGSLFALILLSPVLAAIAVLIKLTSKGPVLFRQTRIGQYGKGFTFLKFRSMYFKADHAIHEEYVKVLISGTNGNQEPAGGQRITYKLTNDPRITPLGSFLRKTSLDELPQFLNVLTGEMSLVGPRPPIPYEFQAYDLWHRRRLLAVKPGITGVWQVEGRSRVKFDDMVRMDLTYANSWSPWMDLKILLRTPGAVLSGFGAY